MPTNELVWLTPTQISQILWWNDDVECEECDAPSTRVLDAGMAGYFPFCAAHGEDSDV